MPPSTTAPAASPVRFLSARGHRLAYLAHNEDAAGTPIIFIHGLTGSVHFWEAAMYEPIRSQRPWYSLSLPFHYPSAFPENGELDEYLLADLMEECLQELLPEGVFILAGYSLGAFAALNYAAKYPGRVRSVISIGGLMQGRAKGLERVLMALSKGQLLRKALFHLSWWIMASHPFLLRVAVMFYAADKRALWRYPLLDDTIRDIFPAVQRHPVERMRQWFRYLREMDVMDELSKLQMPILVIAGEQDPIIPYEHQKAYAEALPNAEFLSLPGTGHVAFGERPEAVEEAIVRWVQRWQ